MKIIGYNSVSAIRSFAEQYKKGKYNVVATYKNGHTLLKPAFSEVPKLYCIYKRDFFIHFNDIFKEFSSEFPDLSGLGESINLSLLDRAIRLDCDYLVFIHENEVLLAYPKQIKRFCEKYNLFRKQNRENVYKTLNGNKEPIREITYSFPKKMLINLNDVGDEI